MSAVFHEGDEVVIESPLYNALRSGLEEFGACVGVTGKVIDGEADEYGDIYVTFDTEEGPSDLYVAAEGLLLVADLPRLAYERGETLDAPVESVDVHDPATTRAFEGLMRGLAGEPFTDTMPDFERALAVGLPVHDPVPADEDTREPEITHGGVAFADDDECDHSCSCPDPVADLAAAILDGRISFRAAGSRVFVDVEPEDEDGGK